MLESKPKYFVCFKVSNTGLVKIGITGNLNRRISSIGGRLEPLCHIKLENPRILEKQLHKRYKDFNVFNPTVKSGNTEFFDLSDE